MTDLLIASHDQAVHAIRERVGQPGVDELLRGIVRAVLDVHQSDPSSTGRPDPDCFACQGRGSFDAPHGGREHCHCRCPWCLGCEEPLCEGPCPTVATIADRLDLREPGAPSDLPQAEAPERPDPFECSPGKPCTDPWCSDRERP